MEVDFIIVLMVQFVLEGKKLGKNTNRRTEMKETGKMNFYTECNEVWI